MADEINDQAFESELKNEPELPDDATMLELEKKHRRARIDNFTQNIRERKKYAEYVFQFTCFWTVFVGGIVFLCGIKKLALSDLVLTTIIGTTTANAFGFMLLVTKYLFNESKST